MQGIDVSEKPAEFSRVAILFIESNSD